MTPRLAALVERYYSATPSRLPARMTWFGAVVTAIGVLLFVSGKSIAGVVIAPFGMFPLLIGGVLWLSQGSKREVEDKIIVVSGAYDRVEGVKTEVRMGAFKSHDAFSVRLHAGKRVIELPVQEDELEYVIATLREHQQSGPRASA